MRSIWRGGSLALVVLFSAGVGLGRAQEARPIRPRTIAEDLQMFSQVLNQIRVNHPDSLDTHRLFMAAVEGMVGAADPHSYVLAATRLSPEKEKALREGKLIKVPVTFRYVGGAPVVSSVAPGSAAARQDILRGDELVAVDGEPVLAESAQELEIMLAGSKGSAVALRLERQRVDGSVVQLERVVRRERGAETSAVPVAFMREGGTGYLRVTTFDNPRVADELQAALGRLEREGMERLILDLRDNGGGLVSEAAQVAGSFLPKDAIIYTSAGRKAEVADTGRVRRSFWKSERRYPIVVLVNHGTASAAELVAGALQDHDRALIVGRPTFGKSLIMQGFPLTDGSLMVLTVGHIRTPCGRSIQRDYRTVRQRDYYRASADERSLAGRPSCQTAGGRTVYGGGGIYPDVVLEEATMPLWLARVYEEDLPLRWAGGYLDANPGLFTTPEALAAAPTLAPEALALFRTFAEQQGVRIPADADAEAQLRDALVLWIAGVRWGPAGFYRLAAVLDQEVGAAARELERAETILTAR
jgi:carboxyl-terminal processing protease